MVAKVTLDNIVPDELLLNNPASPSVVFAKFVAKVVSALHEGGFESRPVVVNVPTAHLIT